MKYLFSRIVDILFIYTKPFLQEEFRAVFYFKVRLKQTSHSQLFFEKHKPNSQKHSVFFSQPQTDFNLFTCILSHQVYAHLKATLSSFFNQRVLFCSKDFF